jgi:hypothetical protein
MELFIVIGSVVAIGMLTLACLGHDWYLGHPHNHKCDNCKYKKKNKL